MNFEKDELLIISSALNEVLNGLDIFEFETRMGASKDEVDSLLKKINSVLDGFEN